MESPPSPTLLVVGAGAGGVKIDLNVGDFRHRFLVESANMATIEGQVLVSPFFGPDGREVRPMLSLAGQPAPLVAKTGPITMPIKVEGLRPVEVEVSARLERAGKYTWALSLVYAKKRKSVALEVTRKRESPPVAILGLEPAYGKWVPVWGGDAKLWLTVNENVGEDVELAKPSLTTLRGSDREPTRYRAISMR